MGEVIGPIIIGIIISIFGFFNMKGNISSVHWYHRSRVTEENRLPFGKMIGLGTIIIGIGIAIFGCLNLVAQQTQKEIFVTIGAVVVTISILVGLALSFYAMIKYNKGIF